VVPFRTERTATVSIRSPNTVPFAIPRSTIKIDHDPMEYLLEDRDGR
jgi:hypothetical protein